MAYEIEQEIVCQMASIYQIGLIHKVGRSAASGCMERRMGAATPLCV